MVNFCNLPGKHNIFTNTCRGDVKENFEHTMALFQEKGMIYKPQPQPTDCRLSLATISLVVETKQLFVPHVYRKKIPAFMDDTGS